MSRNAAAIDTVGCAHPGCDMTIVRALTGDARTLCSEHEKEAKHMKKPKRSKQRSKKNGAPTKPPSGLGKGAVERKRYTEQLPVSVGPEIVAKLADALAKTVREREALREERREANAEFRERESGIADREKRLAESVEQHTELRPVEVIEYLCQDSTVRRVRSDTNEELEVRSAQSDDLQEPLGLGPGDEDDKDEGGDDESNEEGSEGESPEEATAP